MLSSNKILSGLMGVCVGDALGVPVEFTSRAERAKSPGIYYGVESIPPQWIMEIALNNLL
jgi:ADP-ribosyl-[dinitrogen reductase] hydrolase